MTRSIAHTVLTLMIGAGFAGVANASEIFVSADIATSTTWTSGNTYNLQNQIYVLPGATLTIEAGTLIASTTNVGGSLAVTKGAQIMILGTATDPVIMTSKADVATWTGGDPTTGTWREAANEWGNLTIMGAGYISENATVGNVASCDASNQAAMEGLVAGFPGDTKVLYGGGDDDDDSGTIHYLSLRYGGKVVGLNNELNGLSMGGVGRDTDVSHVEIMNNVDDGVETWGGTVNYKYVSVWNVGDDSFDIDQGWRGKGQFILIVQGYSLDASQGSGVGDNGFETDGAEDSDWQPVTTASLWNCTFIGQPVDGDGATAWRDNARIQYHSSVFMDCGEAVVRFDNVDGDGANGYGHNGTLSWADTWTTAYTATSTVNACSSPGTIYASQASGMLAEIRDSVFFRNLNGSAYTEATARGVFDVGNKNVITPGSDPADAPVVALTRGGAVSKGGKTMLPVTYLDPRATNDAVTALETAPNDGFFCAVNYRGAFGPCDDVANNWLLGWTAAHAFGLTGSTVGTVVNRNPAPNPDSYVADPLVIGGSWTATVDLSGTGHTSAYLFFYLAPDMAMIPKNGDWRLVTGPPIATIGPLPGPMASITLPVPCESSLVGFTLYSQAAHLFGPKPWRATNAQDLLVGTE